MTPDTDAEVASAFQFFSSRLPEEILIKILKYHRANYIHGVLVLKYHGFSPFGIPAFLGLTAWEVHWTEDKGSKSYTPPVVRPLGLEVVRKVLEIRNVDRLFARCMLEAFYKSPMVFQHGQPVDLGIKPMWFLPCQIEPKLVERGASIKVQYRNNWHMGGVVTDHEAGIECATTGIDLALSKKKQMLTMNDEDAGLLARDPDITFVQTPNRLAIRGIQFTGGYEEAWWFLPKGWSEVTIQTFFILLDHPDWFSSKIPPGAPFILSLR